MEDFSIKNNESSPEVHKVRLTTRDVAWRRLVAVNDERAYREKVFPYLLQIAGEDLPAIAVAGVVKLAIDRFTRHDSALPSSQLARAFIPYLVDAIIQNPNDARVVKEFLEN